MTSLVATGVAIGHRLVETDLTLQGGQLVALVGPNGGGKTSLLRALGRVETSRGQVVIDGEDLDRAPESRRRQLLSFLPATREVAWPISARDVVALGLNRRDEARIDELIETFELQDLADRSIDRLSTGERARVLMARALAPRPRILLLDEPLSNLDPYWVLRFLYLLRAAADANGQAIMVSLHDLTLLPHFDRALLIAGGRLQMDEAPADLKASERFEEIFQVRESADGGWTIRTQADPRSSP